MENLGTMTLPNYRFKAHTACMYRLTSRDYDATEPRTGWGFFIATDAPFEEPPFAEGDCGVFDGVALYAEYEPIPLPEMDDFTGLDFLLKEAYRTNGEVYFTFDPGEAHDVSDVRISFIERQGERYRIELSAIVHRVFEEPVAVRYAGWIQVTQGSPCV